MEKWEIKLDPKTGKLDLEGLRRGEFIEIYNKYILIIEQVKEFVLK